MGEEPRVTFATVASFTEAYRAKTTNPEAVAQNVLSAIERSEQRDPALRIFIAQSRDDLMQQARASAERYRRERPLGPLDGVPIAVKDEIDQRGYPTTVGTCFLGGRPVERDATIVARLREQGALLIGKTNMHEVGIGATGINPHHGAARNPYDPHRVTGGSSSGSAAAVAAGLCPVAIGADGGGSVRIPAALCGVAGIKPTFGRVSEAGAFPLCWSVAHIGPLAGTLADAALVLEVIAGEDPLDPNTLGQPALELDVPEAPAASLEGLRVGWVPGWAQEAAPDVLERCLASLDALVAAGCQRVDVDLQCLDKVRAVQYVTIGCEMAASQYELRREHRTRYGADTRLLLEIASRLPAVDYIRAQRLRSSIHDEFAALFERVDVLATPSTGIAAPLIPTDALRAGLRDDDMLAAITAFSFPANLTGQPALSVPVGYDGEGMPIGMQLIGAHWDERTLVRVGSFVEQQLSFREPTVSYDVLAS